MIRLRIWTKLSGVLVASVATITLTSGAFPATAAPAAAPSNTTPSAAEVAQLIAAGPISTDSTAYQVLAASPGFHYAPATAANLQKVPTTTNAAAMTTAQATVTPMVTAGTCDYSGKGDNPHVTSGEASVHGYWVINSGSGKCPSTAKVTVDLQALACSSLFGCEWVTQNTKSGTYAPGSGTGHWATPHKACGSTSLVGWRGRIDVNLTDWSDPSGYQYSPEVDLACSPV